MRYYSLNGAPARIGFREAVLQSQAPDKGLYFPENIPLIESDFWTDIEQLGDLEIAMRILKPYVAGDLSEGDLEQILEQTVSFPLPVKPVTGQVSVLELFHGPTLAFKDMGARFMSRCLGRFAVGLNRRAVVLVATSGDTGGAVADAFFGVPHTDVVVLYPSGKVSPVQERQIAALGGNVRALEVAGNFDDCQALVKRAFADEELRSLVNLTSANSINVARWLPQQLYYAFAWKQWADKSRPPLVSVPSGNFGNIAAGLLLHRSGLPVPRFLAACNANDIIPSFLETGRMERRTAVATLSNAMDVADPSNFVRIQAIFNNDSDSLKGSLSATRTSDAETRETIREIFKETGYVLDPHSAVAWHGLQQQLRSGEPGLILSTAHPVKFPDVVAEEIGGGVPVPESVRALLDAPVHSTKMAVNYEQLRAVVENLQ